MQMVKPLTIAMLRETMKTEMLLARRKGRQTIAPERPTEPQMAKRKLSEKTTEMP